MSNVMVDQVKSLPALVGEIFQVVDDSVRGALNHELCLSLKRLVVTGCGDSHHAALNTELAFEMLAGLAVEPMVAMQFARYGAGFIPESGPKTNLVIGISVSGEVARTLEALRMGKQAGAVTLSLTGTPGSRVAMAGDLIVSSVTPAFPEPAGVHCPGVRSFFANQLALLLMAVRIGEVRGRMSQTRANEVRDQIRRLAEAAAQTIAASDARAMELAEAWKDAKEFVFVGSGPNYGTALFSAAKVLEASGDPALGQDTEEWCHLQYFARAVDTPTFFISAGQRDLTRAAEAALAAKSIGRRVVSVAPASASALNELAQVHLPIADVPEMFSPLVAAIPGELFAAYRADAIGEPFFRAFGAGRSTEGGGGISRIRTSDILERWQS